MDKILVVGDLHLTPKNLAQREVSLQEIQGIASQEKVNLIVLLGDTLDNHEKINLACLSRASYFIHDLSLIAPTVVLIGNHDRVNNSVFCDQVSPFSGLKKTKNVYIVDQPLILPSVRKPENKYLFVPYVSPGRFEEACRMVFPTSLNSFDEEISKFSLIFSHQEFQGCPFSQRGRVSLEGDRVRNNSPFIINGHIHQYSIVGKVINVGTPYQHSFGEDEDKALFLIDSFQMRRIPLRTAPRLITYEVRAEELLANPNWQLPVESRGHWVRLRCHVPDHQLKALQQSPLLSRIRDQVKKFDIIRIKTSKTFPEAIEKALNLNGSYKEGTPNSFPSLEELTLKLLADQPGCQDYFRQMTSFS